MNADIQNRHFLFVRSGYKITFLSPTFGSMVSLVGINKEKKMTEKKRKKNKPRGNERREDKIERKMSEIEPHFPLIPLLINIPSRRENEWENNALAMKDI